MKKRLFISIALSFAAILILEIPPIAGYGFLRLFQTGLGFVIMALAIGGFIRFLRMEGRGSHFYFKAIAWVMLVIDAACLLIIAFMNLVILLWTKFNISIFV